MQVNEVVDNEVQPEESGAEEQLSAEQLEERGFNSAVNSLVPDNVEKNPLVTEESEGDGEEKVDAAAAVNEEQVEQAAKFLGDMSEEDVLATLQKVNGLEEAIYERLVRKTFGKFGDVGRQLKALEERSFQFDPSKLAKLKEVDPGIAEALGADLSDAFAATQVDSDRIAESLRNELRSDFTPYFEERILNAMVPDVDVIVKSPDYEDWFFNQASDAVREAFQNWDSRERMDGVALAQAFRQFKEWQAEKEQKKAAKSDKVKRSVETPSSRTPVQARRPMTEEEAFIARTNEVTKR